MSDLADDLRTACLWEATARKAGNVHPFASFVDLTFDDFAHSADAIGPAIASHLHAPLGITVLAAVRATRAVVRTNTNLGMILLLAPLSKANPADWRGTLERLLAATTVQDSADVYEAIRLSMPGGLGKVEEQDVAAAPTLPLRDVMALAAGRDLIARQYSDAFGEVLGTGVPALLEGLERFGCVEGAIFHTQLRLMAAFPDSLIARKRGPEVAAEASRRAAAIDLGTPEGLRAYAEFDRWLRADGHARNPGTTADVVAACLFVALRENRMNRAAPFAFDGIDYRPGTT